MRPVVKKYLLLLIVPFLAMLYASAQPAPARSAIDTSSIHRAIDTALPPNVPRPVYGPNDTLIVPAKVYGGELLPANSMQYAWVLAPMTPAMRRRVEAWTRLRNAVYVTYPYARKAGLIINEMNTKMALLSSEGERKAYIQSREKELKQQFTAPLEQLSIYQGKILMKLINRQTGNNCYEIIKEYKGGFSARFYQTVAFFFSSSLKQPYDAKGEDKVIESIVQEIERMYRS